MAGPSMLESYLVREKALEDTDAIVVMAGNREQRLPAAARLYHEGKSPRILLANDGVFAGCTHRVKRKVCKTAGSFPTILDSMLLYKRFQLKYLQVFDFWKMSVIR